MKKKCPTCGNYFYKKSTDSKKYWKRKKYCSIKCSGTLIKKGQAPWNKGKSGEIGEKSPSYRGGRNISVAGYVRVLIPGTGSYQLEHRKVMEQYLGRKLETREHVHHKNGIKTDNRLKNLEIMGIVDHSKMETLRRWKDKTKSFRKGLK